MRIRYYDDELRHFGVKGMHWGLRKQRPQMKRINGYYEYHPGRIERAKKKVKKIAKVGLAAGTAYAGIRYRKQIGSAYRKTRNLSKQYGSYVKKGYRRATELGRKAYDSGGGQHVNNFGKTVWKRAPTYARNAYRGAKRLANGAYRTTRKYGPKVYRAARKTASGAWKVYGTYSRAKRAIRSQFTK